MSPVAVRPLPADLTRDIGTLSYYQDRALDFEKRHPGQAPPDYYLGYGDKYVHRFHDALRPTLSPDGQHWLDQTLIQLQTRMEARRQSDPVGFEKLEENQKALRAFAFSTHAPAYVAAGLASLPIEDDLKILHTPDFKDLVSREGLQQIFMAALDAAQASTPSSLRHLLNATVASLVHQHHLIPA